MRGGIPARLAVLSILVVLGLVGFTALDRVRSDPTNGAGPFAGADPGADTLPAVLNQSLAGRGYPRVLPDDNWWNLDITDAPVDRWSQQYVEFIGRDTRMHPDFGPPPYGLPYAVVSGDHPLEPITYVQYPAESDTEWSGRPGGFPMPIAARTERNWIQQATAGGDTVGDRHMIIVDRDNWVLYELWHTYWNRSLERWEAGSGAVFDLSSNARRPMNWTSADAAGLELFPGLIRYDEVYETDEEITHAFRVTFLNTNSMVWPALHRAGSTEGALPMGARLRLRSTVDLSPYTRELQKIFRAMQKYGLIVADNGGPLFVTGTMDPRWNNNILNPAFHSITAKDFEIIELGWKP